MAFNLGDMLKNVSNLDTNEERIQKIRLDQIEDDPDNFYQLTGIEELADNIATCGLMDPIRVRPDPEEDGRYIIVSGHRRRSAVALLAREDPEKWSEISCIVENGDASPALQQLRLIYANCNTRVLTSAEMNQQVQQVEKLLYELKEAGYDFPGRMRDHVAEACQVSKTKLARLKVIREKLLSDFYPAYEKETIKESTAYALAQMPIHWQKALYEGHKDQLQYLYESDIKHYAEAFQKIEETYCPDSQSPCEHTEVMLRRRASQGAYSGQCQGCCLDCSSLAICKDYCWRARNERDRQKRENKESRAELKRVKDAADKPVADYVQGIYSRIGERRKATGATVHDLYQTIKRLYTEAHEETETKLEKGLSPINIYSPLPLGTSFSAGNAQDLCRVADLLGCSIDYLLGRTDEPSWPVSGSDTKEDPKPLQPVSNPDTWHYGDPEEPGQYCLMYHSDYWGDDYLCGITWSEGQWIGLEQEADDAKPICWTYMPGKEQG